MNRKEYKHQWYLEHKDLTIQRSKQWVKDHPDKEKEHRKKMNSKQLTWTPTGKRIYIKTPRTGICKLCGNTGQTQYHHYAEYHEDDPLKDTIELCASCHKKQYWKLKRK